MTNHKRKVEQQPTLKLYYFDIKGKGEPIRRFCAYAGLELEDYRFTSRDEFLKLKEDGTLSFGQVPMLEVDGKHRLVQTAAILRYLAKISGLYPEDPLLAAKVDAIMDQETDAFVGPTVVSYSSRYGIAMDDEHKAKSNELIAAEIIPRHLTFAENMLHNSPTGWIAGTEEPSPADFLWHSRMVDYLPEYKGLPEKLAHMEDYPACKKFVEKMSALEAVQEYLQKSK